MLSFLCKTKIALLLSLILPTLSKDTKKGRWQINGSKPLTPNHLREIDYELINHSDRDIPEEFDARKRWPNCRSVQEIVDQGSCNDCWAVVVAEVISDRWCIASNQTSQFEFSAEDILSCCHECVKAANEQRCDKGGSAPLAVAHWIKNGVVSGGPRHTNRGCRPYSENVAKHRITPPCEHTCTNPKHKTPYRHDKRHGRQLKVWWPSLPLKQIQIEIMVKGPVVGTIKITKHFEENIGEDVYQFPSNPDVKFGWHSVKIIGWGVENNVPYWLAANSWGERWGKLGGFFKTLRGRNHLGIEMAFLAPVVHPHPILGFSSANILHVSKRIMLFCGLSFKILSHLLNRLK